MNGFLLFPLREPEGNETTTFVVMSLARRMVVRDSCLNNVQSWGSAFVLLYFAAQLYLVSFSDFFGVKSPDSCHYAYEKAVVLGSAFE